MDRSQPAPEKVNELLHAVSAHDAEAAVNLLASAGGMCQALDLTRAAEEKSRSIPHSDNAAKMSYSLQKNDNAETLTISSAWMNMPTPLASITTYKCVRDSK